MLKGPLWSGGVVCVEGSLGSVAQVVCIDLCAGGVWSVLDSKLICGDKGPCFSVSAVAM